MATTSRRRTTARRADATPEDASAEAARVPANASLPALRSAALDCRACDLWKLGTQTVFGEGPSRARLMVVGEQPGDQEDKAGRPFVGPSGALLDTALDAAGIVREDVYVTNAVKHFKWTRVGRSPRRIHQKPNAAEIRACRQWLDAEIDRIKPEVIVCLGATAAQALLGRTFRVTAHRGVPLPSPIPTVGTIFATVHPSAVLRAPDPAARKEAEGAFVADLEAVARYMKRGRGKGTAD